MTNSKTTEISLNIASALYTPKPWHWTAERVANTLAAANMRRAVAGKASPVAGKALERLLSA